MLFFDFKKRWNTDYLHNVTYQFGECTHEEDMVPKESFHSSTEL